MKVGIAFLLMVLLISCSNGKTSNQVANSPKSLDSIIDKSITEIPRVSTGYKHEVMVLGSFHFDRSKDGSDIIAKNHIDVVSEENQKAIEELTSKIVSEFKPTIVALEWRPNSQGRIDSLYQEFQNGNWPLGKHESFQLGFRIAKTMGLSKLYCVDNRPPQPETVTSLEDWEAYSKSMGHDSLWFEYEKDNGTYNTYIDRIQKDLGVSEYLKTLNSPTNLKRSKQLWLTGLVNLGHGDRFVGADLTGHWYRRNTRIFVNIRNLAQTKNERILVIYGNAHKWILDELFNGSPEFVLKQPFEY